MARRYFCVHPNETMSHNQNPYATTAAAKKRPRHHQTVAETGGVHRTTTAEQISKTNPMNPQDENVGSLGTGGRQQRAANEKCGPISVEESLESKLREVREATAWFLKEQEAEEERSSTRSFDDSDDGIDWDTAIPMLDEASRQKGSKSSTENNNNNHPTNPVACQPPASRSPLAPLQNIQSPLHGNEHAIPHQQPMNDCRKGMPPSKGDSRPSSSHDAHARALVDRPSRWQPKPAPQHAASPRPPSSSSSSKGHTGRRTTSMPRVLEYSDDVVGPLRDEYRQPLVKNANLSSPLLNGWTLYPHQKKAILKSLLRRRMILALDMGLGKTLIGCVWAKAFKSSFPDLQVICVCPVSLTQEWCRTAEEATGLTVQQPGKKKNKDSDHHQQQSKLDMQLCSWAKIPSDVHPSAKHYVLICDEAHSMQSMESARTKAALRLTKPKRCVGVLLLTGTPMKNGKPSNLFPLLKAVKHPFGDHQKAYETYFCAGKNKGYGRRVVWDATGSSNLSELRHHVASHLLHMTKDECLANLPKQTREFRKVPVCSRHQLQHNQALDELAKAYHTSGSLETSGEIILSAVQRVRQIGSYAKVDATVALANEVLQSEPAIVIFTSFTKVAKLVHQKLAERGWVGEVLTGETPAKKRQGMVDRFQEGLSAIFVATFGAGGVGLTLTAAHTVILLDRPWTPGDALQAEDRVRRIGQTRPVTSIWMVAFDLDKQIDGILEQKKTSSNIVLAEGDDDDDDDAKQSPKLSIFRLLKSVLHTEAAEQITK